MSAVPASESANRDGSSEWILVHTPDYNEDGNDEDFTDEDGSFQTTYLALLSQIAEGVRARVSLGRHVKGGVVFHRSFTGKDIVSALQTMVRRYVLKMHLINHDREFAVGVARDLQQQRFFYDVESRGRDVSDSDEDIFKFMDEDDNSSRSPFVRDGKEMPTGVITALTTCYSPTCGDHSNCYSCRCPRRDVDNGEIVPIPSTSTHAEEPTPARELWQTGICPNIVQSLTKSEFKRQHIIHDVIRNEQAYVDDLDILESLFAEPLRSGLSRPPLIPPARLDKFVEDVFGNFHDLRERSHTLLGLLSARQREQFPVIRSIGDVFLNFMEEFRKVYPAYVAHLPVAEKRLKVEIKRNASLKVFLEQSLQNPAARRLQLVHFITRPWYHFQKYALSLKSVQDATSAGDADRTLLADAIRGMQTLHWSIRSHNDLQDY